MTEFQKELAELFNSEGGNYSSLAEEFMYGEPDYWRYTNSFTGEVTDTTPEVFKDITFTELDRYGGEGQGDEYWSVYEFTKGYESWIVRFNGWYQSYNGAGFTDWKFVTPKRKEVTVYE